MKKCLTLIVLLSLLTGCHSYYRTKFMGKRINIIDLTTQEAVTIPYTGGIYPPSIMNASKDGKSLYNLFFRENNLELEKIGLDGNLLGSQAIPFYSVYFGPPPYSSYISPDERKIAYIRHRSNHLYYYDLDIKEEVLVYETLFSNPNTIRGMIWVDNNTLMVILHDELYSGIIKFDTKAKKISSKYHIEDPLYYDYAPKKGLLAITQMVRGSGVKIIDTNSMIMVDEIKGSDRKSWVEGVAWSPSESVLSYVDGYEFPQLHSYRYSTKKLTDIISLPEDTIVYSFDHLDDDNLAFRYGYSDDNSINKADLHLVNRHTHLKRVLKLPGFYSDVTVLDGGKKIAYVAR